MAGSVYLFVALYVAVSATAVRSDPQVHRAGGLPYYYRGQWVLPVPGDPPGEPSADQALAAWSSSFPSSPIFFSSSTSSSSSSSSQAVTVQGGPPEPVVQQQRDDDGDGGDVKDWAVWKGLVVVAVLLVSVIVALSMVYYMCVWRGGRIHYQAQHDLSPMM
ncbi:unnamed protein product [Merluccius merluccius]